MVALLLAWLVYEWARRLRQERANCHLLEQMAGSGKQENAGQRIRDDVAQLRVHVCQSGAVGAPGARSCRAIL